MRFVSGACYALVLVGGVAVATVLITGVIVLIAAAGVLEIVGTLVRHFGGT